MSRLSEELIELLAIKHAPPVHPDYQDDDDWQEFARAIECEAHRAGQEAMRERAANLTDQVGLDWKRDGDKQKVYATEYLSEFFRNLEIEEPK